MATRLDLRTRLKRRLGLGVVSAVEEERLSEAINSGISRALSDGVPGLARFTMVGGVLGNLPLTSASVLKYGTDITIAGAHAQNDHISPNDILVLVTASGEEHKFLITEVHGSQSLHIGVMSSQALTGTSSSYVIRRALHLPSSGQVISVSPQSRRLSETLSHEPMAQGTIPFETGTPRYYTQVHSALGTAESTVSLWPAPTDVSARFVVRQAQTKTRLESDNDALEYTEEVLDAILERARDCYLVWSGSANQNDLMGSARALRDSSDSLKNSSNPIQVSYKV